MQTVELTLMDSDLIALTSLITKATEQDEDSVLCRKKKQNSLFLQQKKTKFEREKKKMKYRKKLQISNSVRLIRENRP